MCKKPKNQNQKTVKSLVGLPPPKIEVKPSAFSASGKNQSKKNQNSRNHEHQYHKQGVVVPS